MKLQKVSEFAVNAGLKTGSVALIIGAIYGIFSANGFLWGSVLTAVILLGAFASSVLIMVMKDHQNAEETGFKIAAKKVFAKIFMIIMWSWKMEPAAEKRPKRLRKEIRVDKVPESARLNDDENSIRDEIVEIDGKIRLLQMTRDLYRRRVDLAGTAREAAIDDMALTAYHSKTLDIIDEANQKRADLIDKATNMGMDTSFLKIAHRVGRGTQFMISDGTSVNKRVRT